MIYDHICIAILRVNELAHCEKELAAKPEGLNSTLRMHILEGKNQFL